MHAKKLASTFVLMVAGAMAAYGCSSSSDSGTEGGGNGGAGGNAGAGGGGGSAGTDGGGGSAGNAGSGGSAGADGGADAGTGFDSAIALDPSTPAQGTLEVAGQVDYYSFTGNKGDWFEIDTQANPDGDSTMVDTVITVFDASKNQIAFNDDGLPRYRSTDSNIYLHLPADGTYYVTVQEYSTWHNDSPMKADPSFSYQLDLFPIDPAQITGGNFDSDSVASPTSNDDVANAQQLEWTTNQGATIGWSFGTFKDASDVDVYKFKPSATTADAGALPMIAQFSFQPSGKDGSGSTSTTGDVWITSADGNTVIAKVDGKRMLLDGSDMVAIEPSLDPSTEYLLWVKHPGGTAGANDFYMSVNAVADENPLEAETVGDSTNDTTASAEALTPATNPNNAKVGNAFIAGHVSPAGTDKDIFAVEAKKDDMLAITCGAEMAGSGLRGAKVTILDSSGMPLTNATATEMPNKLEVGFDDANPIKAPADGTYYFQIEAASQDATVTSDFYRCGIAIISP